MEERLKQLIHSLDMSVNAFEKDLGLGTGTIAKTIAGKKALGTDILKKIVFKYPEINLNWLITGRGEMQVTIEAMNNPKVNADYDVLLQNLVKSAEYINELKSQVSELRYLVSLQRDEIERLSKSKAELEAKIKSSVRNINA